MIKRVLNTNYGIPNTEYLVTSEQRELLKKILEWMPKTHPIYYLVLGTVSCTTYGKVHIKRLNQAREDYLNATNK